MPSRRRINVAALRGVAGVSGMCCGMTKLKFPLRFQKG
jgi:hypothetical protein